MSIEAVVWALKQAPTDDPTQTLVLVGMANHAHDDGTSCWASVETLSSYARCSVRTVHRHLRTLEAAGIIQRGDQRLVDHIRGDHRPVVWDLRLDLRRGDNLTHRELHGVTPMVERGDTGDADGVTLVSHKPSFEVVLEPSMFELAPEPPKTADEFEAWYSRYPRKEDRKDAERSFVRARKLASQELLIAGVERYAAQMRQEKTERRHIKLPATWLNKQSWLNEVPTGAAWKRPTGAVQW